MGLQLVSAQCTHCVTCEEAPRARGKSLSHEVTRVNANYPHIKVHDSVLQSQGAQWSLTLGLMKPLYTVQVLRGKLAVGYSMRRLL